MRGVSDPAACAEGLTAQVSAPFVLLDGPIVLTPGWKTGISLGILECLALWESARTETGNHAGGRARRWEPRRAGDELAGGWGIVGYCAHGSSRESHLFH